METNPELNQEANPETAAEAQEQEQAAQQVITETDADQQSRQESEEIDNIDNSEQAAAGEQAASEDPGAFESVKNAFGNAFGRLLSGDRLAEAAIMYLGSRALGYSHGGSMNWAAKNYLQQIQGDSQARTAAAAKHQDNVFELAKADKFSPASVREYERTGDVSSLKPKEGSGIKRISAKPEVYYDGQNKRELYQYEDSSGNKYLGDKAGRPVDTATLHQDSSKVKDTPEWRSRVKNFRDLSTTQLKSLRGQYGVSGTTSDGTKLYTTDINPETQGARVAEWAAKNDVSPEELGGLVDQAYQDALNDRRQDGEKVRDLTPYLNQLVVRKLTGSPALFTRKGWDGEGKANQYIDAEQLATVNQRVESIFQAEAKRAGVDLGPVTAGQLANQYYNQAAEKWRGLDEDTRKKYEGKANKNVNGFYVFVREELGIPYGSK